MQQQQQGRAMSQHECLWLTSVSHVTDQHQWVEDKMKWKITINWCVNSINSDASRLVFLTCDLAVKVVFYPKTKGEDAIYSTCISGTTEGHMLFLGCRLIFFYILSLPALIWH